MLATTLLVGDCIVDFVAASYRGILKVLAEQCICVFIVIGNCVGGDFVCEMRRSE